ncbi:ABC transporter substrate-binding protein [Promicromonospora thailandica]|uniref:Peptide/nickel transport system substrate-binding protein n=1 Tax=Promicromonospora thailandica TaxID=765201 RepID=A0A9X2G6M6_9MICO|nr:ABC transporter substrate-binding protein [Promicromonospora thailandica]MCP2266708.1 peptide/nickel transport system substrate-binding protein [Promicromonospora thailandica]
MKHQRIATAAVAVVTTLALAACGGGQDASSSADGGFTAEPAQGGTVHVLQNADFSYLDPARGWDGGVNNFYRLVYRQLTTSAPGSAEDPNEIVPDLAQGLGEVSDDGLTWTYTLKDGIAFAGGDPITSAEVKFGISRAWDPEVGIGSPYLKQVIDAPEDYEGPYRSGDLPTIETPDEKTIVFHLKEPFPEFDAVVAQVNATPFPEGSGAGDEFIHEIVASGPYRLAEYVPGSTIQLERNPDWDPATDEVRAAKPDAWEFTIGLDPATIDERLIAGQGADVNAISGTVQPATLPRLQTPQLQERTLQLPGICTTYMGLNTTKKPLDDVRVRQAISYAVDRTAIVNASGGTQLGEPSTTILPSTVAGHKDFDLYPSADGTGDVEAAQELLDEAGLSDGFTLTLDIRAQESMQAQGEAVQQALERVGITVELNLIDTATYYETIGTPSQQHDAAITGWCPDWASSAATFIPPLFDGRNIYEKGNSNLAQIDDPEINARIDEIKAMTDIDAANVEWGDLDEEILALAPVVPLMVARTVSLPGENVTGLHASANAATGGIDYVGVGLKDPEKG